MRCALFAPRWRCREQCAESVILAVGGAAAAGLVFQVLRVHEREYHSAAEGDRCLAASAGVDAAPGYRRGVAAAIPGCVRTAALQLTRLRDLKDALAAGGNSVGNPKTRRQQTLLRWQVAVSAGFFVVATMFVKYSVAEARHDPGVDLAHLGVAVLNFHSQQWDESRGRRALDRVQAEARKDPVVSAVSVSTGMPFGLRPLRFLLSAPGVPSAQGRRQRERHRREPSIFSTLGVPILRGRGFENATTPAPLCGHRQRVHGAQGLGTADAVGGRSCCSMSNRA